MWIQYTQVHGQSLDPDPDYSQHPELQWYYKYGNQLLNNLVCPIMLASVSQNSFTRQNAHVTKKARYIFYFSEYKSAVRPPLTKAFVTRFFKWKYFYT